MSRTARLSALFLMAVGCATPEPSPEPPSGPEPSDSGSAPSYTAAWVTSACDDLSSAQVLSLGPYTHVTDYTDLPFAFPLFGETATRFVAAGQGLLFIGGSSLFVSTGGEPQQPPNETIPNGWLAPFWDPSLSLVGSTRGDVRMLWTGTGADERLVIGYNDFTLRFPSDGVPNPDVHLSFQVALMRWSHEIEFRYCQLDPGPSPSQELREQVLGAGAEIGLESSDGTQGVSYSFKEPLPAAGGTIRFTPTP